MIAKLWPGLSLAIIALLTFFWLRSGCNKPNVTDASQKIEAAAKAAYDSARNIDSSIIVSLKAKSDSLDQELAAEKKRRITAERNLQDRAADLHRTIAALDQARANLDTSRRLTEGDTLEAEVKSGIPAVEGFTHLTDSMINAAEAQLAVKDSIIFRQNELGKVAQTTITAQQLQYEIINKDDANKTAALKFYRPVAIGGIAAVALIVVVSLLHH